MKIRETVNKLTGKDKAEETKEAAIPEAEEKKIGAVPEAEETKEDPAPAQYDLTIEKFGFNKGNYVFGFRFVEGMNEAHNYLICGEGETEAEAMTDARNKADKFSDGKYTVVYTGYLRLKTKEGQ